MCNLAPLSELRERLAALEGQCCEECIQEDEDTNGAAISTLIPATWVAVEYYPNAGGMGGGYCDTFMCQEHALEWMAKERGDKDYDTGWWYVSFIGIAERRRELERSIKEQETVDGSN